MRLESNSPIDLFFLIFDIVDCISFAEIDSGVNPSRPSAIPFSEPCAFPVKARDPYSLTSILVIFFYLPPSL